MPQEHLQEREHQRYFNKAWDRPAGAAVVALHNRRSHPYGPRSKRPPAITEKSREPGTRQRQRRAAQTPGAMRADLPPFRSQINQRARAIVQVEAEGPAEIERIAVHHGVPAASQFCGLGFHTQPRARNPLGQRLDGLQKAKLRLGFMGEYESTAWQLHFGSNGEVQLDTPLVLDPLVPRRSEDPLVLDPLDPRRSGDPLLPVPLDPLVPT